MCQRKGKKGVMPGKMCHRKGREWRRREKLSCWKIRETPQIYLEKELWSQLEVLNNKSSWITLYLHPISFLLIRCSLPSYHRYQIRLPRRPGKCVRGRGGNEGGEKSFRVGKVGKHPSSIWRGNYGVSLKSRRRSQVEYPYTCNPYHYFLLFITSLLTTGIKYGFQDHPGKLKWWHWSQEIWCNRDGLVG